MFEYRRIVAVLGALVLASLATPAVAQRRNTDPAAQRRRVEALESAWRSAWEKAEVARRGYVPTARLDTVTVGALRIITDSGMRTTAQAVAALAWTDFARLLGPEAEKLRARVFHLVPQGPSYHVVPDAITLGIRRGTSDSAVAESAVRRGVAWLLAETDSGLQGWIRTVLPLSARERHLLAERTYVALALTPLSLVRDCYAAPGAACRAALALDRGDSLTVWFTATDRALLVRALDAHPARILTDRARTDHCVRGADSVCLAILRRIRGRGLVRPPLPPESRALLLGIALDLGGQGAFSRLLSDPAGSMADRLTAAAAVPLDSLITVWHDQAVAARPETAAAWPGRVFWASALWVAVFGILAMRSVRWRHV